MARSSGGEGGRTGVWPSRRLVLAGAGLGVAGLIAAWPAAARAGQERETETATGRAPRLATLSPDGRHIAVLQVGRDRGARVALVRIVRTDALSDTPMRVRLGDIDAEAIQWGSDRRLLVAVRMAREFRQRAPIGSIMEAENLDVVSRRLVAIDVRDGRAVALFSGPRMRDTRDLGQVIATLPGDAVLVAAQAAREMPGIDVSDPQISARFPDAPDIDRALRLYRVDLATGASELVETGGLFTTTWHAQDGVAVLRRDLGPTGEVATWQARAPGASTWRFLLREPTADRRGFAWVAGADRPGAALVVHRLAGETANSVRELDLTSLAFGPPIQGRAGRDVEATVVDGAGRYLGAGFRDPDWDFDFVDEAVAADYRAMIRHFGAADMAVQDVSAGRDRYLLQVGGASPDAGWHLYDRTTGRFTHIAARSALTDPADGPPAGGGTGP